MGGWVREPLALQSQQTDALSHFVNEKHLQLKLLQLNKLGIKMLQFNKHAVENLTK